MDDYERRIIRALQRDGALSNNELAAEIGLSASPCHRRVKALEAAGTIKGYTAIADRKAVGCGFLAFASVSLLKQSLDHVAGFEAAVLAREEILEAHLVSGDFDFLLKIVARDMDDFQHFLMSFLTQLPQVEKIRTLLPMRSPKETTVCPVR